MEFKGNYIWCIAYVNSHFLATVDKDIEKTGIPGIKALIPTVKVLRKKFKGKAFFDEIPLLFNYGFFKIPMTCCHNKEDLTHIKSKVPAIYSWLYTEEPKKQNCLATIAPHRMVEAIKYKEIIRLRNLGLVSSVYSATDIANIEKGSYIVLKGYPFDNMPAEVIEVKQGKEELRVKLLMESLMQIREVTVSFSNVFYTVYTEYEDPTTLDSSSLESILERSKFKVDKLYFKDESE